MASGDLYPDPPTQQGFDIRSLFPSNFNFRAKVEPVLDVSSLPPDLQDRLESGIKKPKSKDDLAHFLSQDHLQFMYARFLGPRREHIDDEGSTTKSQPAGDESAVRGQHDVWSKAVEIVKQGSSKIEIPRSLQGMSTTNNEHVRLLSTAVSNLWTGAIYKKSLDYLLRILLRLQLAPERENKYWNRTHGVEGDHDKKATPESKNKGKAVQGPGSSDKAEPPQKQSKADHPKMNRRRWKLWVRKTVDRLANSISRGNDDQINHVLGILDKVASSKPASIQTSIPNIHCRVAEAPKVPEKKRYPNPTVEDYEEEEEEDEAEEADEVDKNTMSIDGKWAFDVLRIGCVVLMTMMFT